MVDDRGGLLDFPSTCVGCSSPLRLGITNSGGGSATITAVTFSSAFGDAGAFTADGSCIGVALGAGDTCTFTVVFHPGHSGMHFANMLIAHTGPGSPLGVGVSGTGR